MTFMMNKCWVIRVVRKLSMRPLCTGNVIRLGLGPIILVTKLSCPDKIVIEIGEDDVFVFRVVVHDNLGNWPSVLFDIFADFLQVSLFWLQPIPTWR